MVRYKSLSDVNRIDTIVLYISLPFSLFGKYSIQIEIFAHICYPEYALGCFWFLLGVIFVDVMLYFSYINFYLNRTPIGFIKMKPEHMIS